MTSETGNVTSDALANPYPRSVPKEHAGSEPAPLNCFSPPLKARPCASSGRVSTKKQLTDKVSVPQQMTKNRDFIERSLGGFVRDEFSEAISGAKEIAERLSRLVALAKAKEITDVVFAHIDRAFRQRDLARRFFREMAALNIHVWIDGKCVIHVDARGMFSVDVQLLVAELERDVLIERGAKREQYARDGTTYLRKAPFGTIFVTPPGKTFRQLERNEPDVAPICAFYEAVADYGPDLSLYTEAANELRRRNVSLTSAGDVRKFILNPVYEGKNPYGKKAFITKLTPKNRIVPEPLYARAIAQAGKASRAEGTLADVEAAVGREATLDAIHDHFLVLCRQCLAPVHKGRTHFHRKLRRPTWECNGAPLDFEALRALVKEKGCASPTGVRQLIGKANERQEQSGTPKKKHETSFITEADLDATANFRSNCDRCGNHDIRKFKKDDLRRNRLTCLVCGDSRLLPRKPWEPPLPALKSAPTLLDYGAKDSSSLSECK